jgi:Acyl-CoA thioesterase C-terminal domain/Acyl-CoA thioesterase N-terminal domain
MSVDGVFVRDGERFTATELGRGPWDPRALHGGAPAALLVHAFERCSPQAGLRLARLTFEFVRPVPLRKLTVSAEVTRPGRRVMWLEGSIRDGDGEEVTRARALRLGPSELGEPPAVPPPFASPERGRPNDFGDEGGPMFATDALEIRFVEGAFRRPGPSTAWFRLRVPIVAGSDSSLFELLAAAGDFGNGIATTLSWEEHVFINPDLTLYLEREPRGEWVALQSEMRVALGNIAVAESVLWDREGRIGRATQALVVGRR